MATTEELTSAYNNAQSAYSTASSGTGNTSADAYSTATTDAVNKIYDAQQKANAAQLESTYNTNLSNYQAAQEKIAPQYQTAANELGTQYEKQRQAFNRQAAASGLNSGTGAQANLAMNSNYQKNMGEVRTNEANAQAEVERQMAQLKADYQTSIQSALAQNDYQRATALLSEYKNGYDRNLQEAQIKAEFGDFSGYGNIYGNDTANTMQLIWTRQNPDLAYYTGAIDADTYRWITGQEPRVMTTGGAVGGGGEDSGVNSYYYNYGTPLVATNPDGTTTIATAGRFDIG